MKLDMVAHMWNPMIQPILLYVTQSLPITKTNISKLDKSQIKLLKYVIGLHKYIETHPS